MADPSRSEADERDDARHENRGKEQAEGEGRRGAHARTLPATTGTVTGSGAPPSVRTTWSPAPMPSSLAAD